MEGEPFERRISRREMLRLAGLAAGVTVVLWRRGRSIEAAGTASPPRVAMGAMTAPGLATLTFSGSF